MTLTYVRHEKLSLKSTPGLDERWLHDRICQDPTILGLGEVRVLDRERKVVSGGRLDLLLYDEDMNRRYEVEVMLGATDPSHIVRTIEYWDLERRRYPGYEHVAVLVAEDVTARFLNVIGLMAGSIPIIAIQLDALRVDDKVLLNFVNILDQADLRVDDSDEDEGGSTVDRSVWETRVGTELLRLCDRILGMINAKSSQPYSFHYLRGYIGLRSSAGTVNNFVALAPKHTKHFVHVYLRNANSKELAEHAEEEGIPLNSKRRGHIRLSLHAEDFENHQEFIRGAIEDTVAQHDG